MGAGAGRRILGAGGIANWIAALMPQFFPVWSGKEDQLAVVGRHAALWRLNAVLFAFSAIAALAGCALVFPVATGPLAWASLLLAVATALWLANNALRRTVVADVATNRAEQSESWLSFTQTWSGALWLAASALVLLAFAGFGATTLLSGRARHLDRLGDDRLVDLLASAPGPSAGRSADRRVPAIAAAGRRNGSRRRPLMWS